MVLPGYLLAGYHKTDAYSTEGAIKYFLLGLVQLGHLPVRPGVRLGPDRDDARRRVAEALAAIVAGHGAARRRAWRWASRS